MVQTVCYVDIEFQKKKIHVKESFLGFIQLKQRDAESSVEVIFEQMEKNKMPLEDVSTIAMKMLQLWLVIKVVLNRGSYFCEL